MNVMMDSASTIGFDPTAFVEECRCPSGKYYKQIKNIMFRDSVGL